MRRRQRITALLGAAALAVPVAVTLAATPAQAAGGGLKVYTLTRAGAQLNGPISVVNLSTAGEQYSTSGKTLTLPAGRYAVIADVWNQKDQTDTIGGQIVTVSASKTVTTTIDARKGRPVSVKLSSSPGTGYDQEIQTSVCAYVPDICVGAVGAYNSPGHIYAIPNASKQLHMGYMSVWNKGFGQDVYAARGYYTGNGMPTSFGGTFSRANTTTVTAEVRRGSNWGTSQDLTIQPQGPEPLNMLFQEVASGGPFTARLHLTAGNWSLGADDSASGGGNLGSLTQNLSAAPGRSYSPIFFRSTFGPAHTMPYVQNGRANFWTGEMFQDPTSSGTDATVRATTTLSFGSRTIARSTQSDYGTDNSSFTGRMTSTGWYTLYVDASRTYPTAARPAYMLSTASTLRFHFYANPKVTSLVPGFLTQFVPSGLNMHSAAAPRSTTNVALWLSRPANPNASTPADSVSSVKVWASYDGGKTWHAAPVTHSGGTWAARVTNPASGAVSLRSTVTDPHGNTAETTVYRAYAIG
ncbi:hypothetical protein [Actinacidiphila acidipaludis]|uniref:Uncharacterized protein n=1 Tax=Actinacidiphila acidipaludis TaxID=2873382 RepID=A0ABS7QBL6_9ACTN|nr:hypothetical protein [Streptomyces acidipaludis]MBY8880580.1 hypothetical protein [Streptomyces acidipaludis]